jgi:L-type amino acid transporter 9
MIPNSGGEYTYILSAFGQLPAFLFVWTSVLVTRPGSLAIISLVCTFSSLAHKQVCGQYIVKPFYTDAASEECTLVSKSVAVLVVLVITLVNSVSVAGAIRMQDIMTILKLAALAIVCITGMASSI